MGFLVLGFLGLVLFLEDFGLAGALGTAQPPLEMDPGLGFWALAKVESPSMTQPCLRTKRNTNHKKQIIKQLETFPRWLLQTYNRSWKIRNNSWVFLSFEIVGNWLDLWESGISIQDPIETLVSCRGDLFNINIINSMVLISLA